MSQGTSSMTAWGGKVVEIDWVVAVVDSSASSGTDAELVFDVGHDGRWIERGGVEDGVMMDEMSSGKGKERRDGSGGGDGGLRSWRMSLCWSVDTSMTVGLHLNDGQHQEHRLHSGKSRIQTL